MVRGCGYVEIIFFPRFAGSGTGVDGGPSVFVAKHYHDSCNKIGVRVSRCPGFLAAKTSVNGKLEFKRTAVETDSVGNRSNRKSSL
jgi:hypothetical protein